LKRGADSSSVEIKTKLEKRGGGDLGKKPAKLNKKVVGNCPSPPLHPNLEKNRNRWPEMTICSASTRTRLGGSTMGKTKWREGQGAFILQSGLGKTKSITVP